MTIKTGTEEIIKGKVNAITRVGGYWYWDWIFPFRHYRQEEIYFATDTALYRYGKSSELTKQSNKLK